MSQNPSSKSTGGQPSARIDKGAESFKKATSNAVEHTHDTLDRAADKIESGMHRGTDRVAGAAGRVADSSREKYNDAMEYASDWADKSRGLIRDYPVQSVAVALTAGWLIGRLMRRR